MRLPRAAEDSLNISLREITVTGRDGRVSQLEQVYIRGSMIRYFIVPDMLQNTTKTVSKHINENSPVKPSLTLFHFYVMLCQSAV